MTIRATSDLHLTADTADYVIAALLEVRAHAEKEPGMTIIPGDILDQPDTIPSRAWRRLNEVLQAWPEEIIVVPGNHDQTTYPLHALDTLAGGPVTVVDGDLWAPVGLVLPYGPPSLWSQRMKALESAPAGVPRIVWAHQGFRGALMNTRRRDHHGIPVALPPGWNLITGHYHSAHSVGPHLHYCGSPYEVSFAEEGDEKSFIVVRDGAVERVPYGDLGAPRHITIDWEPAEGPPSVPSDLKDRDIVRVRTTASKAVARQAEAQLRQVGLAGAPLLAQADSFNAAVQSGMTEDEAFAAYVQAHGHSRADIVAWGRRHELWD